MFSFRRMRESITDAAQGEISKVIVAGLSNVYTHYITTYQVHSNSSISLTYW